MRTFSLAALASLLLVTTGCSTHPLPEDFSRRGTKDLVQYLRCELASGVAGIRGIENISQSDLEKTAVGVDLKLNMTEVNNAAGGKIGLSDPISGGKFLLDFEGSAEKSRSNERTVRIIDTFKALKQISKDEKCNREAQSANFVYPIAGSIGVDEIVNTYWDIKGLTTYDPDTSSEGAAFSDKLIFNTKLSTGVSPSITVSSGSAELRLTNLGLDIDVSRQDVHQITITLSTADPKKDGKKPNRAASESRSQQTSEIKMFRADPPRNAADDTFSDPEPTGANQAVDNVVRKLNIEKYRDRDDLLLRRLLPD
jgi:hypothetical protein